MSLCESIDTLAMAYLDDELAPEERREVELHVTECASCRVRLDGERADRELVRAALVAPRAPELLRARVTRALDADDRAAMRQRFTGWLLPAASMVAAAAALVVFVGQRPEGNHVGAVVHEAVRQQSRSLAPTEVQRASTGSPMLAVAPAGDPMRLVNRQATRIDRYAATQLAYLVNSSFVLTALAIPDIKPTELDGGDEVNAGDRKLHVVDDHGRVAVTYFDADDHVGYVFYAPDLGDEDLVRLVVASDLVQRAAHDR